MLSQTISREAALNKGQTQHTRSTMLLIDDSKTIRHTAQTLLSGSNWDVVTAADGYEGLAKLVDCQPDIIFTDLMMPRLNGYEICILIKSHPFFHKIPVILLSSKESVFDRAQGGLSGADDYLCKPFTHQAITSVIEKYLGSSPKHNNESDG